METAWAAIRASIFQLAKLRSQSHLAIQYKTMVKDWLLCVVPKADGSGTIFASESICTTPASALHGNHVSQEQTINHPSDDMVQL